MFSQRLIVPCPPGHVLATDEQIFKFNARIAFKVEQTDPGFAAKGEQIG